MGKSLTADRRNQIAQILMKKGSIKVGDLSKRFGVSTETIRKDIIYLEGEGIATKSHGGAIATSDFVERPLDVKEMDHAEAKAVIATEAVDRIPPGGAVVLDTGSTTTAIARQLLLKSGITIFTNSVTIAGVLAESDNNVFLLGGLVRPSSKATVGGWALEALSTIHADIAFLGSDGFEGLPGPSTLSYEEAAFKRKVITISDLVYTVADSSKCSSSGLFGYADWHQLDGLIIDSGMTPAMRDKIQKETRVIFPQPL
ncbi:DeoR/GlpR family DNA-binding transcription regulator [Eubacterium sp.]|uniref:DeoR/GlpR family DNA-binding transcription regulator n=1 Tax=Eubacterium sp. TaxID=142586 RepID=UPI002FC6D748